MKRIHMTSFGLLLISALAMTHLLWLSPAGAAGETIGINILLNRKVSSPVLDDLGRFGQVLDVIPAINAVSIRADESALSAVRSRPYVKAANPDRPRYPMQSGGGVPVSDFSSGSNVWNLDAINVTDHDGSRTSPYDGDGVYVAVFDSGLAANWRDYFPEQRIDTVHARAFGGGGGEKGTVSEPPMLWEHDTDSHGTAVTSVILGFQYTGPEDLPRYFQGVAPKATIIPVKVFNNNHNKLQLWSSVWNRALIYLADLKSSGELGSAPLVVNMSLGGPDPDAVERAVIDYAISRGVIVVAAAGNTGDGGMVYPAAYPPVISAAASGWVVQFQGDPESFQWILRDVPEDDASAFFIQWFSSREHAGQDLDVAAPGWPVPVAWTQDGRAEYTYFWGTSAASPHVAGVAALMLQKNPSLTQAQIEAILEDSALALPPGFRQIRDAAPGPGNPPTWGDHNSIFFFDATVSWGADATGHGLLRADAALAATPPQ